MRFLSHVICYLFMTHSRYSPPCGIIGRLLRLSSSNGEKSLSIHPRYYESDVGNMASRLRGLESGYLHRNTLALRNFDRRGLLRIGHRHHFQVGGPNVAIKESEHFMSTNLGESRTAEGLMLYPQKLNGSSYMIRDRRKKSQR